METVRSDNGVVEHRQDGNLLGRHQLADHENCILCHHSLVTQIQPVIEEPSVEAETILAEEVEGPTVSETSESVVVEDKPEINLRRLPRSVDLVTASTTEK